MHSQDIGILFGLLQRIGSGIASLPGSIQKIRCGNLKKLFLRLIEKADCPLLGQNGAQPLCKERKGIALPLGKGGKHNAFLQRIPMQSIAIFQSAALRDIVHRGALQRDLGSILRTHTLQGLLGKGKRGVLHRDFTGNGQALREQRLLSLLLGGERRFLRGALFGRCLGAMLRGIGVGDIGRRILRGSFRLRLLRFCVSAFGLRRGLRGRGRLRLRGALFGRGGIQGSLRRGSLRRQGIGFFSLFRTLCFLQLFSRLRRGYLCICRRGQRAKAQGISLIFRADLRQRLLRGKRICNRAGCVLIHTVGKIQRVVDRLPCAVCGIVHRLRVNRQHLRSVRHAKYFGIFVSLPGQLI